MSTIRTIGHSNQQLDVFIELVGGAGIEEVIDVRSWPTSRWNPQFDRREIAHSLGTNGIGYRFEGTALGGRPSDDSLIDRDGHVRYDLVAATSEFSEAVSRLEALALDRRVVLMCAEADPTNCHRRLLIGTVLRERHHHIVHLLSDGTAVSDSGLAPVPRTQPDLFGTSMWRSIDSIR